ncbi:MAG: hypothetical protein RIG63_08510 [Coleofasciculus chthonoplastes F3-SA18-01]
MPTLQYSAIASLLHGSALMFVAYTGYGRIATLAHWSCDRGVGSDW